MQRLNTGAATDNDKNKAVPGGKKIVYYDYSRFFGRGRYRKCGECAAVIDSFGVHRCSSPYLFRRSFPGGAGGFRLGGFSHAASPAAFASLSFEAGVKTPAVVRVSPAQSNPRGNRRPAAGSHRKTASLPGLIWSASSTAASRCRKGNGAGDDWLVYPVVEVHMFFPAKTTS